MFDNLLDLPRAKKNLLAIFADTLSVLLAFVVALVVFEARIEATQPLYKSEIWGLFIAILPVAIFCFIKLGLYNIVLRYISLNALWPVIMGVSASVFIFISLAFILKIPVPRTVPFIFGIGAILLIGGSRLLAQSFFSSQNRLTKEVVLIYGAGAAGRQLATALSHGPEYYVLAFIDDDKSKQGSIIQGIKVHSVLDLRDMVETQGIKNVLLALPSASVSRRREILSQLEHLPVHVMSIPGMADLVTGKAAVSQFNEVEISDLLGREAVQPDQKLMSADIKGKVVMVTGAGGSIGSELCRQILKQEPSKLILFELSEFGLYSIDKELQEYKFLSGSKVEILPIVGSVQKINRISTVMSSFSVDTVYHAAAYKHVPLVEHNVVEGVRNNVFGTYYTAKAAIESGVSTFVLISTDKAVRPTNVMGTTKRMAELVLQALATTQESTRFCMVRFGNVLGSSGSVVPLFRRQIQEGGPITLTHKDITRYFMTIPEASQLVIQAGAMGKGGDVFVLDMGESVKIKDLAEKMVRLSGYSVKDEKNPNGDIEILCTGLRPGEKLYEELLIGDNVSGTFHERILTALEVMLPWDELENILDKLDSACHDFDHQKIRELLLEAPTGFNPTDGICDLVWLENKTKQDASQSNLKRVK